MTEEDRILAAWYCNECYGKYFLSPFKHGVTSEVTVRVVRNTDITVSFVVEDGATYVVPTPIIKRTYAKDSHFKFEFFDPHGTAPNGPEDTIYVSYWGDLAGGCWGDRKPGEYSGSYSTASAFENSQIYFADLRNNILVYQHETGTSTASTSGDSAIGPILAYAEWDGSDISGCKGITAKDAIKMPLTLSPTITKKEIITLGNVVPSQKVVTDPTSFNVAASDHSGYSGGVAYDTYKWGNYTAIDQTQPFSCSEGYYTELASPENLEAYFNSWDRFGGDTSMDDYDRTVWESSFNGAGINYLPDGAHSYPSFINIDPLPHGSWVLDAEGNRFYSMITVNLRTFNDLNSLDPQEVAELEGAGVVFYPVGLS